MRYYYDTEFLENGSTIELISIGIVAEDGRELYAVNADAPWDRIAEHDWLMANVVPKLGDDRMSRDEIRDEVTNFLRPVGRHGWRGDPELWAWYGAYDHVVLAQLFGRMIDFPEWMPMWSNDVRQEQHRLGNPGLPAQPAGLHNALEDARHTRVRHEALIEYAREKGRA